MKYLFGYFRRPVGAAADVKELEYISAIHQSAKHLNPDGTITADDVRIFLRSRYGVVIARDDAIDIVKGLSGKARLPLPTIEKKAGFFGRKQTVNGDDATQLRTNLGAVPEEEEYRELETTESSPGSSEHNNGIFRNPLRRRGANKPVTESIDSGPGLLRNPLRGDPSDSINSRTGLLKNPLAYYDDDDDNIDDANHHWGLLDKATNIRREWHFKKDAPKPEKISKKPEKLVKYDLVELLSFLYIPTLVRMERFRFAEPLSPKVPPPPKFDGAFRHHFWQLSGVSWYIFKLPYVMVHELRRRRLVAMKDALRPKPDTIMDDVLRIMLGGLQEEDAIDESKMRRIYDTGSVTTQESYFPKVSQIPISEALVRQLLMSQGEKAAAQDQELVRQMVKLVGGEGSILNERSFAHAMTADVQAWPMECEDDVSSSFYDVYGFNENECNKKAATMTPEDLIKPATKEEAWAPSSFEEHQFIGHQSNSLTNDSFHSARSVLQESRRTLSVSSSDSVEEMEGGLVEPNKRGGKIPGYRQTVSYIDYAADTFQSVTFVVFLFCFYVMASIYLVMVLDVWGTEYECPNPGSFGCTLTKTVFSWLSFAITLSVSGLIVIIPISVGNNQFLQTLGPAIFSASVLTIFAIVPWIEVFCVDYLDFDVNDEWQAKRESVYFRTIMFFFTLTAGLTQLLLIKNVISVLVPKFLVRRFLILRVFLMPSSVLRASSQKRAATSKINNMIENAHKLHRRAHKKNRGSNAGHATILNFVLHGEKLEDCAGFWWTWKSILTQRLFKKEGVWLHARLAIGQLGQVMLGVILGFLWWYGIQEAADSAEKSRQDAIDRDDLGTRHVLYFVPTKEDIYYSLYPGGTMTLGVLLILILVYIPSTASSILKFRSGFFQSLHDPNFSKYRAATDGVYYNTGNMIYAFAGSALVFFLIFGGLLFLCFWEPTQGFMLNVIAWGIGLTITILLKMVLTSCCRSRNIKAFFRIRPGAANISTLALECWHIGLGGGVLLGRLTQFLLAMAFWVGRIDSVFLSEDVEVFGYRFDTVPFKYISEILVHDAHRHPYVERMGAMYLMRLKYGEHFCSDAGAAWRRLFISTLYPWMLKYRAGFDDDADDSSADEQDEQFPLEEPENQPSRNIFSRIPGMKKDPEQEEQVQLLGMSALFKGTTSPTPDLGQFASTRAVYAEQEGGYFEQDLNSANSRASQTSDPDDEYFDQDVNSVYGRVPPTPDTNQFESARDVLR